MTLLLLLLLCSRAHFLTESHVGDFEAGNSADANGQNEEKQQTDSYTNENAFVFVLATWQMHHDLLTDLPWLTNWYFSKSGTSE